MEGGREQMSSQLTPTITSSLSHPHQTHLIPSHSLSGTVVECLQIESHHTISLSQDQFSESLHKEIELRNSRIQELEDMHNETCTSFSRLVASLRQEIDCLNKRKDELELECMNKAAVHESSSRLLVSLLREIDHKDAEIVELNENRNEMYMVNKRLFEERDMFQRLYHREVRRMQVVNIQNKRLKSELKSAEEELGQLKQGRDGAQSHQEHGCSVEKNEMNAVDFDIRDLKRELEDKTVEVQYLQNLNETLLLKERMSNNELLDARRELLSGLQSILTSRMMLGIKRMGELNPKSFREACAQKFPEDSEEELGVKCAEVCSLWEEYLKDSNWHPFKHNITDGKHEEVINESDERLERLRKEWGEEPYEAVKVALLELNEYNPSGRYPIPEIWNFKEKRKVSLKEVIGYMIQQVKTHKRKR